MSTEQRAKVGRPRRPYELRHRTIQVSLLNPLADQLLRRAKSEDKSVRELVRTIVSDYLEGGDK